MTSPLFFEMDARIKDILDQARSHFPDGDFHEGQEFYDHGEWELALDSIFWALKVLHRDVPVDLYEKIVNASERMSVFDVSHWDEIRPKKNFDAPSPQRTALLPSEKTS